ncbi:MAG: hypothetical protein GF365_05150 [Candidatus Buchananbacteria bacterium]|nr:hypothetical protein [Candidatus Buchananbacteria bacterium]
MKKIILQTSLTLFLFGILFFYPQQLNAKTIITEKDGCFYEIKVKIVFDFQYQLSQSETEKILTDWRKAMSGVWNGVFGSTILNDQCFVYYDFELVEMGKGKICNDYPEFHCISVIDDQFNSRNHLADATIVKANSFQNSWGEWTNQIEPLIAAHEVGHMMGLSDEYEYKIAGQEKDLVNLNYRKIGPQSIMAQTWGEVAAFKEHSLRILKLANIDIN